MKTLIHIGYHKTASTWLQKRFFPDPNNNFFLIEPRIATRKRIVWPRSLDFSIIEIRKYYQQIISRVRDEQKVLVFSDERFSGNPFSGGFDSKDIADRIRGIFDNCIILIVIREQRSMLYSVYDEYVREGGVSSVRDFLFPKRRYCIPLFRFEHFMYDKLISYYFELFGRKNVLVLPYEYFKESPIKFLDEIVTFGGARLESHPNLKRRENVGRPVFTLPIQRRLNYFLIKDELNGNSIFAFPKLYNYFVPYLEKLAALAPKSMETYLKKRIQREINYSVKGRYEKSNMVTATYTNINLAKYGYAL